MNNETFNEIISAAMEEAMDIMESKGKAYSGIGDRLGNFNRLAAKTGVDRLKVWQIFFTKHIDAIDSYLRGEYTDSEPIESRIVDAINYLLILYAMHVDKKTPKPGEVFIVTDAERKKMEEGKSLMSNFKETFHPAQNSPAMKKWIKKLERDKQHAEADF